MRTSGALLGLLWGLAGPAFAQSLVLHGPNGQSRTLSAAEISALPHQAVTLAGEHGPPRRYEGPPLTQLLQSVGAPAGEALRGPAMADMVVIEAADGYRVVLALAETDASIRPDAIILADRADGAALAPPEGPLRLVVGGDRRPARSARMVTTISVLTVPAPK